MPRLICALYLSLFIFTIQAQDKDNRLSTSFSIAHNEFAIGRIACCRQVIRNERLYSFSNPGTAYRWTLNYYLNKYLNLDFGFAWGSISHQPHLSFQALQNLDLTAQFKILTLSTQKIHISPYLLTGISLMLPKDTDLMVPMGVGFRFKLLTGVYAQAGTTFHLNLTEENNLNEFAYLQHSLGLSFGLSSVKSMMKVKDQDKDKVKDKNDECPDEAGLAEFKGCPDSDGDKIKDSEDECPNRAGLAEFGGCPDSDGDKIRDKDDECPNQSGSAEFKGCPDSDGDGIRDKDDECPNQSGSAKFKGCPDSDGDGIRDKDDECPNQAGLKVLNGCPKTDLEAELEFEANHIQFETGSDVIKPPFYVDLNIIVMLMLKYPNTHFRIEGHTDSVGTTQDNQELSQKRAEAVRNYFISKGVKPERLFARGYGESKPIMDNKTEEGRRLNKRVEIHLKE